MKIGINIQSIGEKGYGKYWGEKAYEKARSFGFEAIDFSYIANPKSELYSMNEQDAEKLILKEKALVEKAGMFISQSHAPVLSHAEPYTAEEKVEIMDMIKKCIRFCFVAGCPFLVVHPFMVNGWSERGCEIAKDTFNKNVEMLRELGDYAKEYNVVLCYENMPCIGFSISHPFEVLEVVKAVNHENVGICFDTGHSVAFECKKPIGEQLRNMGSLLKVLHVHDGYGRADQHNFPGMGVVKWDEITAALKDINYNGVFSLELNHLYDFSEDVFEEACRLSYKMANNIINR